MIWREKQILLIILAVLLLGNVVFFLTYRVQYQSRLDEMDERLEQMEGQLEQTRRSRATAEQSLIAYRRVEKDVKTIFDEHWSTQPRRLTRFIGEVKRLAVASNAVPQTLSFTEEDATLASTSRGKRADIGAKEVGISFSVEATYDQTRRMINLFELSHQFVIIDEISLNAGAEDKLSLSLRLKTLFRENAPTAGNGRT